MARIDEALELLELGDWISQYTDIRDAGDGEVRVSTCPMCGNDKYKLYVNTRKQRWICYVCDWGRGLADPVLLMSAISERSRFDIRLELTRMVKPAPKGDITAALKNAFDGDDESSDIFEAEEIELPGSQNFQSGITSMQVLNYAYTRGIQPKQVRSLGLRYASMMHIKKRSGKPVPIKGPFLVFPVIVAGRPVSYQGRRLVDADPKYVSASNVSDWLWPLGQDLFDVYDGSRLYLVEGVFDALGLLAMGHGAVCTFGKSISDRQLSILDELAPQQVVFAWDLDAKQEVARAVDRVAYKFTRTGIISFEGHTSGKVDPGNALQSVEAANWIRGKVSDIVDVRSPDYFRWRMA